MKLAKNQSFFKKYWNVLFNHVKENNEEKGAGTSSFAKLVNSLVIDRSTKPSNKSSIYDLAKNFIDMMKPNKESKLELKADPLTIGKIEGREIELCESNQMKR